jgi:FKBP-type peptidyl-prolyl cis-trans isomerase FklB
MLNGVPAFVVAMARLRAKWENRKMQRLLTSATLSAALALAGVCSAQTSTSGSNAATPQSAPAGQTSKSSTSTTTAKKSTTAAAPAPLTTKTAKFSYALGMNIGKNLGDTLKKQSVAVDWKLVMQGLRDSTTTGSKTRLTEDEAKAVLTEVQGEVQKQQMAKVKEEADKNKAASEKFLADNKGKEGIVTLPSGLEYKIVKEGTGAKPTAADSVECNYKGTLIDGTEFDSSYKRGKPATFGVGQVIKGWTEALQLMPVGSTWQLFIPPALAYGERGEPRGGIGPNQALIFQVELISIVDKNKPADQAQPKPDAKAPDNKTDDKNKQ